MAVRKPQPLKTIGSLVLVGVNHTTAPIEVRERLSIPAARLADAFHAAT